MTKNKEQVYEKAKLGGDVGFGKRPAILIIDFQKGFTVPDAPAGGDMKDAVEKATKIVDAGRERNIKNFYTRVGFNKDGSDLMVFGQKATILKEFTRDHWYYEYDDQLDIRDEDITIEKHWPSPFFGTHLQAMLTAMHIDTLILTGCTTAGCIYAAAIDACSYGYRTIVAEDGIADRSEETHEIFLWNMGQKYADIMTSKEIVEEIRKVEKLTYDFLY